MAGKLLPVFDLNSLLGGGVRAEAPQWLVACRAQWPLALAFDRFEGCASAGHEDVFTPAETTDRLMRQAVRIAGKALCVIDIPAAVAAIRETYHSR